MSPPRSFVEKAEDYLRQHPNGVRTRDVSAEIGQGFYVTEATMRLLVKDGKARRTGDLWFAEKPS